MTPNEMKRLLAEDSPDADEILAEVADSMDMTIDELKSMLGL